MTYKIAVSSTDGKVVNQHFGKSQIFYIVEADSESMEYKYVESRKVRPVCSGQDHDPTQLEMLALQLKDCDCVLVSRIGYLARMILEQNGVMAYEIPGVINESVKHLISYITVQKLLL